MSGICGWIGREFLIRQPGAVIDRMVAGLPQRSGLHTSSSCDARAGLALAPQAESSAWLETSDLLIAIDGYPHWRSEELSRVARDRGEAKAIELAYRKYHTGFLDFLRGQFALAVIERTRERAFLAIDRLGTQSLCYACCEPGGLVFGATTDSVRAHPTVATSVSLQSIFDYFYFVDRVPAPRTIYRELQKLPPGHCLTFDHGRAEVKQYWKMPYAEEAGATADELSDELNDRLRVAVSSCTAGEHPSRVGSFLSGGLDSSTIVAFLAETAETAVNTFTIGFEVDGFDETPYAEIVARHFATNHDTYYMTPGEALSIFPTIARFYDEPFGNPSALPVYCCAMRAKQAGMELLLAGDGGDELFAGNARYVKDGIFDHYRLIPRPLRRFMIEPLLDRVPARSRRGILRKAVKYVDLAKESVPFRMTRESVCAAMDPLVLFEPDFLAQVTVSAPLAFAQALYDSIDSRSKLQRMMHFDLRIILADGDLRKVGRMCDLAGLRVRYPFLDDDIVEFSGRIPPNLLIHKGRLRYFYKRALRARLPQETLQKSKHGFGLPFSAFAAYKPFLELFCDTLAALKKRHYIRRNFLDELVDHTYRGNTSIFDCVIWELAVLELWLASRLGTENRTVVGSDLPRRISR